MRVILSKFNDLGPDGDSSGSGAPRPLFQKRIGVEKWFQFRGEVDG